MSTYRGSLPADQLPAFNEATARFVQEFRDAEAERDALAAAEGTRAVAEAAYYPGHPLGSVEAIQEQYEAMQDKARRKADAA